MGFIFIIALVCLFMGHPWFALAFVGLGIIWSNHE